MVPSAAPELERMSAGWHSLPELSVWAVGPVWVARVARERMAEVARGVL
ncbi:hypothetical protein [Kyrpidia spormannii]|nr:hypothetical protein [Kyrpidia spormannii]